MKTLRNYYQEEECRSTSRYHSMIESNPANDSPSSKEQAFEYVVYLQSTP